ncbi:MAG: thiol:disulfide interchange protein [Syntrophaceae bacterium]|nr:thiol:disulfide interchange protein [Syntrophaceae bacterium]
MEQILSEWLSASLHGSFLVPLLAAYLGGVLVSFTPCVYPVIPITVAYIGNQGAGSRRRALLLSIVYVTGMSLTYSGFGAMAALSGSLFGRMQSNPWVSFAVGNLCLLMGLSMLDVFSLSFPVPQWVGNLQTGGRIRGMAGGLLMGVTAGFIVGPCTAPILAVLLGYVAAQQNVPFGMALLFVFSFGMGTLLILLGTFSALLAGLPKSGLWMERIRRLLGWILVGSGEYFLIQAGMFWG